jgi:hypothetical protein
VLSTVRQTAAIERQRHEVSQRQQRTLTLLLGVALFVLTSALGLAVYFLLF